MSGPAGGSDDAGSGTQAKHLDVISIAPISIDIMNPRGVELIRYSIYSDTSKCSEGIALR